MGEKKKKTTKKPLKVDAKKTKKISKKNPPKKTAKDKVKKDDQKKIEERKKQEEKEKKQDRRRILYIEIDDEVTGIFDRIKSVKQDNVYLVIPKRAVIFQSIVNLKILKRKSEDLGKQLSIITGDTNGTHLANLIELPVYESINANLSPKSVSGSEDDSPSIAPMKASGNSVQDDAPLRLKQRKLSISEFLHGFREKHGLKKTTIKKRKRASLEKNVIKKKSRFVFIAPNRQALVTLIIASLVIFLVITYIALPGATIYLTPKSTVLEKSVNVTMADYARNTAEFDTHPEHMIATYPINHTYSKTISSVTTGKLFKGTNASGNLTIINESDRPWPLVAKTRFQNPDGIVYRIGNFVTVPANGSTEVRVIADELDAYGQIVGERGNIGPSNFFLPGLRETNRHNLHAKSEGSMSGGNTVYLNVINEQDISSAEEILKEELKKGAVEELKNKVLARAQDEGSDARFELLIEDKALQFSDYKIDMPGDLLGKQIDKFEIKGEIDVSGVYFNHDELIEILRNELMLKKSPEKKVVKINNDSIVYSIFDEDKSRQKIRVTASIKGIEEYDIDPKRENGKRLTEIIKDHVVGKKISDAKDYIQNLPEVNKVVIESWPSWAPTIPSVSDNIEILVSEN